MKEREKKEQALGYWEQRALVEGKDKATMATGG